MVHDFVGQYPHKVLPGLKLYAIQFTLNVLQADKTLHLSRNGDLRGRDGIALFHTVELKHGKTPFAR